MQYPPSPMRIRLARIIAVAADFLQIALFPILFTGWLSPANILLDVLVGLLLWRLVGWHWVFLPGFLIEQVPMLDLAPTWTLAVFYATRAGARSDSGRKWVDSSAR